MTLQGHCLGRIAARSVASQCFALGLNAVTPMARHVHQRAPLLRPSFKRAGFRHRLSRSRLIINPRHK